MAADGSILALMTNTCTWEAWTGTNKHGEPTFAAGKTKTCWIEEASRSQGAVEARWQAQATTYDPSIDLWFDASDADVQAMTMIDRFTVAAGKESASGTLVQQPQDMTIFYGPDGSAWVKNVRL